MKRIKDLMLRYCSKRQYGFWLLGLSVLLSLDLAAQNVAAYQLEKAGDNLFQVNMITDTTFAAPLNRVANMQISIRVQTGGFQVANLTNLVNNGLANEVQFANFSRSNAPAENPSFDYISFSLVSLGTIDIPFVEGDTVPLFSFQNGGVCTADSLYLVTPDDPFFPPNSEGDNVNQQLSVLGFQQQDAPVGIAGRNIADCVENCLAEYEIERLNNGAFQVSLTPRITYNNPDNRISNLQVTIKVRSGGFLVGNIINQINTGQADEVRFEDRARFNSPPENPAYDYISFNLQNSETTEIDFVAGEKVPLFTFNNIGVCTEDTVRLIDTSDPFYPPNSGNLNSDQQLSILGFGMSDAPICVADGFALDCTRECFLGCNDNVQVSLGINCTAEVVPEMVATALNLTCPNGPKGIEILENGVVIPTSPFLDESHIGRTFQVRVIDSTTTNSCWGSIIVKDKTPPIIECQDDTLSCGIRDFSPDNPLVGYPLVIDNCSDTVVSLTFSDRITTNGCDSIFSGTVERTWTAVDSFGSEGTCIQTLYFLKQSLNDVVFPPNRDGTEAPIVDCADGVTDPTNTGVPSIGGNALYPNFVGFCSINAGFRDDSVAFCEGYRRVVRTWTVVDGCTGDFRTDIQIISVQDTTPPLLVCPDTIVASVDLGICTSTVTFPSATVTDECSSASVSIETPFGTVNSNGGILPWMPLGFHQVVYVAVDACNNETRCTTILNVVDRTIPIAACDFINDVSLRSNGTVDVLASAFDDDSRDGCSGNQLTFQVRRVGDTTAFADFVTFDCADAGDTVNITLRVTDLSGNADECVAAIVISNDSPPQINCPANQTIQCDSDYSDLSIFGTPTIIDDCNGQTPFTESATFDLNTCGVGTITRTFTINHNGNTISCSQVITVENNSTFNGNTIVWPADYTTFACSNAVLVPDSLPIGFDVPRYDSTGSLCNRIIRNFEDALFDSTTDTAGCFTILRRWSVIDWCIFNPNDTLAGGYWSHVQQIDLVNSVAPTITNCPDSLQVNITDNSCFAFVPFVLTATDDCTPDDQLVYNYSVDLNDDGSIEQTGIINDASANYQAGTHRLSFWVSDDCGNVSSCTFRFTVTDSILPFAVCNDGTINISNIGDEQGADVNPTALALNSSDNCTDFANLNITASPSSFSCSQLGLNQVTITVTDEAGNSNTCIAEIQVNDSSNGCPQNLTAVNISGIIANEMGQRVEQVEVSINHPDVLTSMTNIEGEFKLEQVPVGNDYTILPERDFDILNGISTFDLVLLNRHILNVEPIKSPYRLIAADVNRSGSITAFDIVLVRKLILRLSDSFPNNTSWRFVRTDFEFENPTYPNKYFFPEVYNINDLPRQNMEIEGFVAVKIGDINGSALTQSSFAEGESRAASDLLKLSLADELYAAGTIVDVPINAINFDKVLGFQFALNFDPNALELVAVLPNDIYGINESNFGKDFIKRGILTTSWNQAFLADNQNDNVDLFQLRFKVKEDCRLSKVISINKDFLKAEAYNYQQASDMELLDIQLLFEYPDTKKSDFNLFQNQPNPFSTETIIGFELPNNEEVTMKIIDVTGKTLKILKLEGNTGYNQLIVSNKDLGNKGIYYYQLSTSLGTKTKKMLVLK